jgi:YD repeat-containing protein
VSYDAQARLTTVTLADGTTMNVRYNAAGQRAEYTVSKMASRALMSGTATGAVSWARW